MAKSRCHCFSPQRKSYRDQACGRCRLVHRRQVSEFKSDRAYRYVASQFQLFIFPTVRESWGRTDIVQPIFKGCYLHLCAALYLQLTADNPELEKEILSHQAAAASCLAKTKAMPEKLKTILSIILFQRCVRPLQGSLLSIPWHTHFRQASELARELEIPSMMCKALDKQNYPAALIACIDILGSSIRGQAPEFALEYSHCYRSSKELGIRGVLGCRDTAMYLISEITVLASWRSINAVLLRRCVEHLRQQIFETEHSKSVTNTNITMAFLAAARIYLFTLVPGFRSNFEDCTQLVSEALRVLRLIPGGPNGCDRSLLWVYLICGSVSPASSPFRTFFNQRLLELEDSKNAELLLEPEKVTRKHRPSLEENPPQFDQLAYYRSMICLHRLLEEVWRVLDQRGHNVTWGGMGLVRSVMSDKSWDFLPL